MVRSEPIVRTVSRIYDDPEGARQAVAALEAEGFTRDQISYVGHEGTHGEDANQSSGTTTGITVGGVAGAGAGLLLGLGIFAIPGLGALVAAGVLASTLAGAATGSVAGGLLGALVDSGVSENEAQIYAEAVRRGGVLVSVQADNDDATGRAGDIMDRYEPIDLNGREQLFRAAGWQEFDPDAPAYTKEQIKAERSKYRPIR